MFDQAKCDLCGDCIFLCPYVDYDRTESVEQFRRLMEGDAPPIISQCVTCVACNDFCDKDANPFDLILKRQEETGVLNIPEENIQLFSNLPSAPSQMIPGEPGKPTLSLCSVGDLIPGLFDGPLFEGFTVLKGGDYFCGLGWIHLGQETPVRENAPRLVENLAGIGADEIILYHDDCYALLTNFVDEYNLEVPFRPVHIIDYLLELLKERKSDIKPLNIRAAYQQPCASRYTPWKDARLDELFELIGVERVERDYDRESALCCGSPVMPRDRSRAREIKSRNVEDALSHGAQAMVYLCPLCFLNLRKAASNAGLENYHLIELAERSLFG